MNSYTLNEEAQNAFQVLHKYWTENFPTASLIVTQQPQILDENGIHGVVIVGCPPSRTNINELLTDCLTSIRLNAIDYSEDSMEDFLPVVCSIGQGRQLELFAEVGRRIQQQQSNWSLNQILAEI